MMHSPAGRPFVGFHALPCPTRIRGVHHPPHQVIVQGWLRDSTPRLDSPGRARRRTVTG